MNLINKNSSQPLYQQIKDVISGKINQGQWLVGEKIPSENELVESLAVSRMTVHRALRELTREGLLHRVHGLGTFISRPQRHASLLQLKDIAEEIETLGSTHTSRVLTHLKIRASAEIARQMECPESNEVYYLKAIHFQDGVPIQLEERYVNPRIAPGFIDVDFNQCTATQYLVELLAPDEMEHIVQAVMPGDKTRDLLMLEPHQPCLRLSRRTWKKNSVITYVTMTYPGERYDLAARYSTADFQTLNA